MKKKLIWFFVFSAIFAIFVWIRNQEFAIDSLIKSTLDWGIIGIFAKLITLIFDLFSPTDSEIYPDPLAEIEEIKDLNDDPLVKIEEIKNLNQKIQEKINKEFQDANYNRLAANCNRLKRVIHNYLLGLFNSPGLDGANWWYGKGNLWYGDVWSYEKRLRAWARAFLAVVVISAVIYAAFSLEGLVVEFVQNHPDLILMQNRLIARIRNWYNLKEVPFSLIYIPVIMVVTTMCLAELF